MDEQIELLRGKLEELIATSGSLIDSDVVALSQELDKLICQYHLMSGSS